jgi:hypothetical protein
MIDDMERQSALLGCQQDLTSEERAIPPYLGEILDEAQIKEWFLCHRPDAVVGFNNFHYFVLKKMGIRIPQDIGYAELLGIPGNSNIAGVDTRVLEVQIKCAEHIDFLVRHKRTGTAHTPWDTTSPVRWLPGESLPLKSAH